MPEQVTGGWYQLLSIIQEAQDERAFYDSQAPMACPRDGEPFRNAPTADSGSDVELYCVFCGFHYPRDWDVTTMSGM